jgi:hypothetical protein
MMTLWQKKKRMIAGYARDHDSEFEFYAEQRCASGAGISSDRVINLYAVYLLAANCH